MKLPALASAPLLLAGIALAARYNSAPLQARQEARVYRPPIVRRFSPAPGYIAELRQARQDGERDHFSLLRGNRKLTEFESQLRTEVDELPPYLVVTDVKRDWRSVSHVYQFQPELRELTTLTTIGANFRLDTQGRLLAETWDNSIGPKPYPGVVLRLSGREFRLATDQMAHTLSREYADELIECARKRGEFWKTRAYFTFSHALYNGQPDLCRLALQESSASLAEKRQFLAEYRRDLRNSRWGASFEAGLPQL